MRKRTSWLILSVIVVVIAGTFLRGGGGWIRNRLIALHAGGAQAAALTPRPGSIPSGKSNEVTIPFDLVRHHVLLECKVNGSRPLSFILDTGDKYAIVDLDLAGELGVTCDGAIDVIGTGSQHDTGAFVQDATFTIPRFEGFAQPVTGALHLRKLAPLLGHDVDGIIGAEFIKQFVVEVDYQARVIKLHDRNSFVYSGLGESIPIQLNSMGHPIFEADVTPVGRGPVHGKFALDIGASGSLMLHRPFIVAQHLPGPNLKTIKALGAGGVGGQQSGRIGRVSELQIGTLKLSNPVTYFSEDKAGAYASKDIAGEIGEQITSKFKLFLDYGHDRIIFEPSSVFAAVVDPASSGLGIEADGRNYKTFRIKEVLENSPASEAGLQVGDVIIAIDAQAAADLTLTKVLEMFEQPDSRRLTVRRGGQILNVTVRPRPMV
jgi:PDZ domain/Aspartyl protease